MEDAIIWCEDVRGVYSAASGYLWLGKNYRDWNVTPNFSWIWRTNTQRKIQFLGWLIGQGALPTNSLRFQRHMADSAKSSHCSATNENILHALRDCPHSLEIWMRLGLRVVILRFSSYLLFGGFGDGGTRWSLVMVVGALKPC
ncbi:hypothetical protein RIF29_00663 [Crotalaria pallida]|uniref:Reverse transcriptase zinc-binding domain-containing protein n=1 Tax=Crotalaria pallida TaxID=3830 RepID=A0AAN9P6P4_CROPI